MTISIDAAVAKAKNAFRSPAALETQTGPERRCRAPGEHPGAFLACPPAKISQTNSVNFRRGKLKGISKK
jgi:hypothetical protein